MNRAGVRTVEHSLMEEVLTPYREHCRYLKEASIECVAEGAANSGQSRIGHGVFSIPESCYIDDTGHFNAVEFNICYNQLAYVTFAAFAVTNQIDPLRNMTLNEFRAKQLPNMLIGSLCSTFKRQINARSFRGRIRFNRLSARGGALFMKTSVEFADQDGGAANGEVLLVLLDVVSERSPRRPGALLRGQTERLAEPSYATEQTPWR